MVQRGSRRHRITLQRPAGSRDAVGERTTTWSNVVSNVPAKVTPLNGRDEFLAAQWKASTTHSVELDWMPQLAVMDASWRVLFGTRIFTIDAPPENVDERNKTLILDCTEGLRLE